MSLTLNGTLQVFSYTLGHKKGVPHVDDDGAVHDETKTYLPPLLHQFGKGAAGKALKRTRFAFLLQSLLDDGEAAAAQGIEGTGSRLADTALTCHQCLMMDGQGAEASQRLAAFCARHCSVT